MKPLLIDFLRRWWWVIAFCLIVAALTPLSGFPVVLAPVGPLLLIFDAQRGGIRPLRLLPITLRELSTATWLQSVALLPVLSILAMLPAGIFRSFGPEGDVIWFRIALQGYVGLGYAAAMLLPAVFMSNRPPEVWHEHIVQSIVGALWGFSFAGMTFVLPNLPKSPQTILQWHWVLFAIVPIAVVLSYVYAGELIRRRAGQRVIKSSVRAKVRESRHGTQGIPLFLLNIPVRAAGITLFIFLSQHVFFKLMFHDAKTNPVQFASMQCVVFGIMFAALMTENAGLRALRVLPMRSSQLALLLSAPSLATALTVGLIASWQRPTSPGLDLLPLDFAFIVGGLGALVTSCVLYFPRAGKFILIGSMMVIMPFAMTVTPRGGWGIVGGLIAGIAGFTFLVRGVQRAPSFYQTRRIFGMFADQPQC